MTSSTARERKIAWMAWIAVCLIWGTTYLGIRISLETMPPMLMAGLRWTLAGGLLAVYMRLRGERFPGPDAWGGIARLGFLLLVLGNGGVVWAEQSVPSGLAAVIVASSPFWMAGTEALRKDGDRLTVRITGGLLVGFSGMLLLVWPDLTRGGIGGRGFLAGVLALQLACAGWSLGSSYSRRHARNENVFTAAAAQMLAGGIMMLLIGTLHGEWRALGFSWRSGMAFGYLATIGAVGGFVAYSYALRHLPVALVSLYAYINPVIAVALGVLVLGEPFTTRMAIAAGLVLTGVTIVRPARGGALAPRSRAEPLAADVPGVVRRAGR